ncbi:MAG: XkdX family protein [Sarcina sp.]
MWYNEIKNFYDAGLYTVEQLDIFVKAGMITETEKQNIIE